ncbi:MAG: tetratricopeptide repeat protein [Thermoplasmata archaeon]|nr:tetratricopeptide repeat protein [Thermoplasmata archaeon]
MPNVNNDLMAGEQYLSRMEYSKAHKHFSKAIKQNPKEGRAYFGKAEASIGVPKADAEEVASLYKKAIDLDSKNPQFIEAYAVFCMDMGHFNEAETLYSKVAELDEDNAPYYYTDFAIRYYTRAPQLMESLMDEQGREIIARKSLSYLLKALSIDGKYAKKLLD